MLGRQGALLTSQYAAQEGWKLSFTDENGLTPLHYCANQQPYKADNERVLRLMVIMQNMLEGGADINAPTAERWGDYGEGATPLMFAMANWWGDNDHPAFIDFLLERGADVTATDAEGRGVINYMPYPSRNRHYEPTVSMLKHLHAAGVDIMHKDPKSGESHFDHAMRVGDVEFAMQIMEISQS